MSEHMFGCGRGHMSTREARRVDAVAQAHGASLVMYTDPQCSCGYGCRPFACRRSERWWFVTRNYGEPSNSAIARAVTAAVGEIQVSS